MDGSRCSTISLARSARSCARNGSGTTGTESGRLWFFSRNAASSSLTADTSATSRERPNAAAPRRACSTAITQYGFVELDSTATRERFGRNSLSSSSRFSSPPAVCEESPVTFPPGRARLATIPAPTGSPADMTIGMELVALRAASVAGVPQATMTSTGKRTNSTANSGNRSAAPSAKRYSISKSAPSPYPSSSSPTCKPSRAGQKFGLAAFIDLADELDPRIAQQRYDFFAKVGFIDLVDFGSDLQRNAERPCDPNGAVRPLLGRDAAEKRDIAAARIVNGRV